MSRQRAFTLIELLVVIAIIAVLMSILIPSLNKAKVQVKAILCRSNLHQWGLVMQLYTSDNRELFPADMGNAKYAALGRPELKEYFKIDKMLLCPMATKTYEDGAENPFGAWRGDDADDPLGNLPCSYGINSWIVSKPCASGTTEDRIWRTPNAKEAANAPMILDCAGYENACPWEVDLPPAYDGEFIRGTNDDEMKYLCLNRHDEYTNAVFLDFSARRVGLKQLWTLKWNRKYNTCGPWTICGGVTPDAWPEWMRHMKDY